MKNYISLICIWFLRILKVSVIINFRASGMIKGLSNEFVYYYDCDFVDLKILDNFDQDIINKIPNQQPFEFQTEKQ